MTSEPSTNEEIKENHLLKKILNGNQKEKAELDTRSLNLYLKKRIEARGLDFSENQGKIPEASFKKLTMALKSSNKTQKLTLCCIW